MPICPQCEHANPPTSTQCDRCGTSLTHKRCHECGAEVAFTDETCGHCSTQTGAIWWAAVAGESLVPVMAAAEAPFLDAECRYRLLDPANDFRQGRVHDIQPLEPVPLRAQIESDELPPWLELYLHIADECQPTLPNIHHGWEAEGRRILLFADRSEWTTVEAQLATEPSQPLQILSWMAAMVGLWEPLVQAGCGQTLLEADNLRLDEDRVLGLQQLHEDLPDALPSLPALGKLWQEIFGDYLEESPSLAQLLQDTGDGSVETLDDLYERLEAIAYEQEGGVSFAGDDGLVDDEEEDDDEATVVLPMQLQSLDSVGLTDVGRKRRHNEDFFFIRTDSSRQESVNSSPIVAGNGLYIVCDGMGGHAAGEVASAMAAETLRDYLYERGYKTILPDEETLREAIFATNEALYAANQEKSRSGLGRMGTTLVMVAVQGTKVAIAHVGDSRVYRVTRRGGIEQVTVDHEVGQRNIQRGVTPEIAYAQPDAYQLTQAIGPRDNSMIAPDIQFTDIDEDTLLLLCSDGLSDNDLLEENYETYLLPMISSKANLKQGMEDLIAFANERNGHDNITGVLVRVKVAPAVGI